MADIQAEIQAANQKFGELMRAKNAQGLSDLYASDVKVMPPGGAVICGRDACMKMMEGLIAAGCTGGSLTTEEVGPEGETIWERGNYIFYRNGDAIMDSGKYLVIWKREDGQLKLFIDIWNSGN
ncbi:uncharacterized protein [Amphiura filiformis]|uniref:uncharacterized protein n=1 Tax=Amphiura filiformis TaxID=82378 RepID=UPI003B216228